MLIFDWLMAIICFKISAYRLISSILNYSERPRVHLNTQGGDFFSLLVSLHVLNQLFNILLPLITIVNSMFHHVHWSGSGAWGVRCSPAAFVRFLFTHLTGRSLFTEALSSHLVFLKSPGHFQESPRMLCGPYMFLITS